MGDADKAVVDWLHQQQDWLQQAAELLLQKGALDDADIANLTERLKSAEGQQVTTGRTFAGLTRPPDQAEELRLVSIGPVEGIERLAPRNPLNFGDGNLSVIFGLNGSGKSGYTRILKRASGKPRAPALRSDVYAERPARRQCTITFKLGTNEHPAVWDPDGQPIDELRAVDFFDADAATNYLESESGVTYEPPAIALLRELAQVCTRVRDSLKAEQDKLTSNLPLLNPDHAETEIGRRYRTLSANVADEQVEELTAWKASHQAKLDALTTRLTAGDPATLAKQKRATRTHVLTLAGLISDAVKAISAEGLSQLRGVRQEAASKRKTAGEAAKVAAGAAVLDGVGSATWRAMWEAARKYSATAAYPEQDFPVTDDDAKCVLCQQELAPDAAQRLQEFEQYIQGTLEKEATAAEAAYSDLLAKLPDDLGDEETLKARCMAAGLPEGNPWLDQVVEFATAATDSVSALRGHEVSESASELASPDALLEELARRAEAMKSEAEQLDRDATPEGAADRARAAREQKDLSARKWVSEQAAAVLAEVERLRHVAELERLRSFANSAPVSNKATGVSEEVVTQAYADRFNEELKSLVRPHERRLKVALHHARTERGQVLYQLRLTESKDGTQRPVEILSEGEKRVVSLAAFLADVADKPHAAPFVFDDPISSLDLDFEWNVAVRLAQLGLKRQVVVFTHRLSFFGALEDAARKISEAWRSRQLCQRFIESFDGASGCPASDLVWAEDIGKILEQLLERMDAADEEARAKGAGAYRIHAQGICTDFRKLLERTVENDLFQGVVRRHRRSLQTEGRLNKVHHVDKNDCELIDRLMTRYSCFEHSQSPETPVVIPEPRDLRQDLDDLKKWRSEYKERIRKASP